MPCCMRDEIVDTAWQIVEPSVHASVQAIYNEDHMLGGFREHLDYRWERYQSCKKAITKAEGSLAKFAQVRVQTGCD